jgi:hypothetical protein
MPMKFLPVRKDSCIYKTAKSAHVRPKQVPLFVSPPGDVSVRNHTRKGEGPVEDCGRAERTVLNAQSVCGVSFY